MEEKTRSAERREERGERRMRREEGEERRSEERDSKQKAEIGSQTVHFSVLGAGLPVFHDFLDFLNCVLGKGKKA